MEQENTEAFNKLFARLLAFFNERGEELGYTIVDITKDSMLVNTNEGDSFSIDIYQEDYKENGDC